MPVVENNEFGERGAVLSDCGNYRYHLWRRSKPEGLKALFCMLNPSMADALLDDPTIRRCIGYARDWGFEHLEVVNLFAFRCTYPTHLWNVKGCVIGRPASLNDQHIVEQARQADLIVAAWGNVATKNEFARARAQKVLALLSQAGPVYSIGGVTKVRCPPHPLYLPKTARPEPFVVSPLPLVEPVPGGTA